VIPSSFKFLLQTLVKYICGILHSTFFFTILEKKTYSNLLLNFQISGMNIKNVMNFKLQNDLLILAILKEFVKILTSNAHKKLIYVQLFISFDSDSR